jgi:hypothetical protein
MSQVEFDTELAMEGRLKALVYQYVSLYERWSEDRQVAAQQSADVAELVKIFTEQVNGFKELEARVRRQMVVSLERAASNVAKEVGEEVGQAARGVMDASEQQLSKTVHEAQTCLTRYEEELISAFWNYGVALFILAIGVGLLTVWLLMPRPTCLFMSNMKKMATLGFGSPIKNY